MRKLSLILFTICIVCFLSSCMHYQLVSIDSKMQKTDNKEFIFENDTMVIYYNFYGINCPVSIRVFNKLESPLYIDWSKSAAIFSDKTDGYYSENALISATIDGVSYGNSTSGNINGVIYKNERVSFIAPKSFINRNTTSLCCSFFKPVGNSSEISLQTNNGPFPADRYVYNDESSMFKFRSFLTFSTKEDMSSPIYFERTFWASEIINTGNNPESLLYKPSNRFYMKKTTGFGKFMGCTIIAVTLIALAALSPASK